MHLISVEDLRLSVLDQSPIPEGFTRADALCNTLDLARLSEELGYRRYWLAEHHGTPGLACNSPEVLIGPVAAATTRIRVGSGGVMLPHYSPLKVAENFGMLESLFPGRIDLGIGRAAGTSQAVALALQRDRRQRAPDDFPEQLNELLGYLSNPDSGSPDGPQIWLLGSSPQSAIWAAELGLSYCFADFINPEGAELAQHYARIPTFCLFAGTANCRICMGNLCRDGRRSPASLPQRSHDAGHALQRETDCGAYGRACIPISAGGKSFAGNVDLRPKIHHRRPVEGSSFGGIARAGLPRAGGFPGQYSAQPRSAPEIVRTDRGSIWLAGLAGQAERSRLSKQPRFLDSSYSGFRLRGRRAAAPAGARLRAGAFFGFAGGGFGSKMVGCPSTIGCGSSSSSSGICSGGRSGSAGG